MQILYIFNFIEFHTGCMIFLIFFIITIMRMNTRIIIKKNSIFFIFFIPYFSIKIDNKNKRSSQLIFLNNFERKKSLELIK